MAPRADMKWSVQAFEESYYLSNICPQNHDLNAGDWLKTENLARRMAECISYAGWCSLLMSLAL